MSFLTLQSVGFDYGRQVILDGATLTIGPGERYGLVGINGAGKSTLLKLIDGEIAPDRGSIQRKSRLSIGHLPQDTKLQSHQPLREAVRQEAFGELLEIQERLKILGEQLSAATPEILEEYGKLHERFEAVDGYSMESRTDAALLGLGFEMHRLDQPVNTLSGGQQRRAALATILLAPHDLLLLDEPTNHLDLQAREWLEDHLAQRRGALLTISHDRAFLDRATEITLHLVNARLTRYPGGYTHFQRQWIEQKGQWEEQFRRQQDHIARTETFIRKNIAGQRTAMAKSRQKQLKRLERIEAPPGKGHTYSFDLKPSRASGAVVFEGHGLGQRFGQLQLYGGLDLQVLKGEKLGILGPNGTGKTTLLKALAGEMIPTEGHIVRGHNVDRGYFDQDLRLSNEAHTCLEEIRALDPTAADGDLRSLLGAFGFRGDKVEQKIPTLSGGERARLVLLRLIMEKHNTLLLDEPTNHLDTDTREALEEALELYTGTLICVSHDRYFLNRICDHIIAFEGKVGGGSSRIRKTLGNYDDYRRKVLQEKQEQAAAKAMPAAPAPATVTPSRPSAPARKRDLSKNELAKIRREIGDLEEEITLLELSIEEISKQMARPGIAGEEMASMGVKAQELQKKLDETIVRWEERTLFMERDPD